MKKDFTFEKDRIPFTDKNLHDAFIQIVGPLQEKIVEEFGPFSMNPINKVFRNTTLYERFSRN